MGSRASDTKHKNDKADKADKPEDFSPNIKEIQH
jgi:hypothetical protein